MISATTNPAQTNPTTATATQAQSAAKAAAPSPKPASLPTPSTSPMVSDTVQISNAARALQETLETPAQTAKEASRGDRQAQRLLAKETAAEKLG
jgi:hypothetical protein